MVTIPRRETIIFPIPLPGETIEELIKREPEPSPQDIPITEEERRKIISSIGAPGEPPTTAPAPTGQPTVQELKQRGLDEERIKTIQRERARIAKAKETKAKALEQVAIQKTLAQRRLQRSRELGRTLTPQEVRELREEQRRKEERGIDRVEQIIIPEQFIRETQREGRIEIPQRVTIGGGQVPTREILRAEITPKAALEVAGLPLDIIEDVSKVTGFAAKQAAEFAGVPEEPKEKFTTTPKEVLRNVFIGIEPRVAVKVAKQITSKQVEEVAKLGTQIGLITALPTPIISAAFIGRGGLAVGDVSLPVEERIIGGIELGFGIFLARAEAKRFFEAPIIKEVALRPIKDPTFKEIQATAIIKGKPARIGTFEITGEVKPPVKIIETIKARELLGLKPLKITIKPAVPFIVKTPGVIIGKDPFVVSEAVKGKRFATLTEIKGISEPITLEQIKQLTKVEKLPFKRFAEERVGRVVSDKDFTKFLRKDVQRTFGKIETEKLIKIKPLKIKGVVKEIPPGRRIERFTTGTEIKLKLETPKIREFEVRTLFKETTKPFGRAVGKTPELRGTLIELKEPIIISDDITKFVLPKGIKKTPFAKTFQEQKQILKQIAPLKKPLLPKQISLRPLKIKPLAEIPRAVGGLGLVTSQLTQVRTRAGVRDVDILSSASAPSLDFALRQEPKFLQREITKQQSKVLQKELTKQKTLQKLKPLQKISQKQFQKQITKASFFPSLKITPLKKIEPPVILPPPPILISRLGRITGRGVARKGFNVFVKGVKTKNFIKANRVPLTKSNARDLRDFVLDTSLGRTGEIRATKRKIQKPKTRFPRGFSMRNFKKFRDFKIRKERKIPLRMGRVIERKSFLLDTPQEIRKIGVAKRIAQLRKKTKSKTKSKRRKR